MRYETLYALYAALVCISTDEELYKVQRPILVGQGTKSGGLKRTALGVKDSGRVSVKVREQDI